MHATMWGNIVAVIIAIVMAVWVYEEVKSHGGQWPWLWAIGAFVFWPAIAVLAGFKYGETALKMVGITGLFLFAALGIGFVAIQ